MTSSRLNVMLSALLVVTVALVLGTQSDLTQPNWQLFQAMKRSPASHAFEVNAHFSNRRTQQPPIVGTIPRGRPPLHFNSSREDAVRAGEEILNPYRVAIAEAAATPSSSEPDPKPTPGAKPVEPPAVTAARALEESEKRGADVYRVHCVACHGASGKGDGLVAQRGFPPPPPLPAGKSAQMKDGQLFHILTWGQGSMSPMAGQLTRDQRWDVLNFVRTLQVPAASASTDAPQSTPPQQ
jgi:mono/diheme cytochrome c family protein